MTLTVLGIGASPRLNGNSDILMREALRGCARAGAQVESLRLVDYNIQGCTECNICQKTGVCALQDDYATILEKLLAADRFIFATPVFFMAVSAQAKLLIDRGQGLWARKHVLQKPLFEPRRDRRAMIIAVGGSRSKKQFDGIHRTLRSYFDCMEVDCVSSLFVNQVDEQGSILEHREALSEAFRLGQQLVDTRPCAQPVRVELF